MLFRSMLGVVVTIFWRLFFSQTWQLFVVSLVTVLIAVVAAHWFSRRDDAWTSDYSGPAGSSGDNPDG